MALAGAAVSARCSLEGPWGDTLNGACFSNSSSFIFSCLRIHGEWGNRLAGAFMLSHCASLIGTAERQRDAKDGPWNVSFFFCFYHFFSIFQDDNAYGEISNRARREESLAISFFLIQEKFFSFTLVSIVCLYCSRIFCFRIHAGSIIMVVALQSEYIYIHHISLCISDWFGWSQLE